MSVRHYNDRLIESASESSIYNNAQVLTRDQLRPKMSDIGLEASIAAGCVILTWVGVPGLCLAAFLYCS